MKVILLKDIPKVGNKDEVKDFKEGYAQNVLLSKGLAILATPNNLLLLNARKEKIAKQKEDEQKDFESFVNSIDKVIIIKSLTNEKGHLFKSISKKDIVNNIKEKTGRLIDDDNLVMDPIKEIGTHAIQIKKGATRVTIDIQVTK